MTNKHPNKKTIKEQIKRFCHTDEHGRTRTNTDAEDCDVNTMDNAKGKISPQQNSSAESSNCPCKSVTVRVSPCSPEQIKDLRGISFFLDIDLQFADFILKIAESDDPLLYLAAAIASNALHNSHICVDLNRIAGTHFPAEEPQIVLPNFEEWLETLKKFPQVVSQDGITPLILDSSNRLYLHRYWNYENELAKLISEKCHTDLEKIALYEKTPIRSISKYFNSANPNEIYWQQVAIFAALVNDFTLITGGPGTGKTSVVSAILAMLINNNPEFNIKLCAPTGKAAARLKESINDELTNLNIHSLTTQKLKEIETYTIHRLLGSIHLSPHFKHNEKNKLSADVIIVDEASMVSLPLFTKLMKAIPEETKLILLGDKDQLNSVEAGAVLANICDAGEPNSFTEELAAEVEADYHTDEHGRTRTNTDAEDYDGNTMDNTNVNLSSQQTPSAESYKCPCKSVSVRISPCGEKPQPSPLINSIIELKRSYRFDDTKGIGLLKNAINNDPGNALEVARTPSEELILKSSPAPDKLKKTIKEYLQNLTLNINGKKKTFQDYIKAETKEEALEILSEFKILCSHRRGIFGVENINKIVKDIITPLNPRAIPIMITENNDQLGLYNGDIGIAWNNNKVYFYSNTMEKSPIHQAKITPQLQEFPISLLPAHEEVFAMTIHKSQGSGFQKILIILPDKDSPILTRELLYTAITRAKKQCEIWANDNIFTKTAQNKTLRDSGLMDKLLIGNW